MIVVVIMREKNEMGERMKGTVFMDALVHGMKR